MASDTHLHRRVTRLENETESIYELITEIRATQLSHTERLGVLNELKGDVTELKADVTELKADVTELKADVTELKADVTELKTGFRAMQVMMIEVLRRLPEPA